MQEKFMLTEKPQEAMFFTSTGWAGSMGEGVLDPETGRCKFFQGLPIYMDSEIIRKFTLEKAPDGWMGEMRVSIAANIKLVKKTAMNYSIPGGRKETFWEVEIIKLHEMRLVPEELPEIPFLTMLENVLALEKLKPDRVGQCLGINLTRSQELSDESSHGYEGQGEGDILKAELRVPGPRATAQGGLLSITLNPALHISANDVTMRFGIPASETPPSGEPPRWVRRYHAHGALVSFEFSMESLTVQKVMVDRT